MYEYTFHLYLQITTPWSDAIMMNTILQIKKKRKTEADRMSDFSKIVLKVSAWVWARAQEQGSMLLLGLLKNNNLKQQSWQYLNINFSK